MPFQADLSTDKLSVTEGNMGPVFATIDSGTQTSYVRGKVGIEGALAVGATYSGTAIAPPNGAVIEGNVGIGTSSPTEKLEVSGTIKATAFQGNGAALTGVLDTTKVSKAGDTMTGTLTLPANGLSVGGTQLVASGGKIGIGVTPTTDALEVNGSIKATTFKGDGAALTGIYRVGDKVADSDRLDGNDSSAFARVAHDHGSYVQARYGLFPWLNVVAPATTVELTNFGGDIFTVSYNTMDSAGNKSPLSYQQNGPYHPYIRLWYDDTDKKWYLRNSHPSVSLFIVVKSFAKI